MVAAVEWSNLDVAGAFVVGAALGTIATLRIMRIIAEYFARKGKEK